ncbi:hypothetical protein PMAYCL1PPCAC_30414, partial [Pristionchus mayeri]
HAIPSLVYCTVCAPLSLFTRSFLSSFDHSSPSFHCYTIHCRMEESTMHLDVIEMEGRMRMMDVFDDLKDNDEVLVPRTDSSILLSIFGLDDVKEIDEMTIPRASEYSEIFNEREETTIDGDHSRLVSLLGMQGIVDTNQVSVDAIPGQIGHELSIREELAKAERKREIMLNQLWQLPDHSETELHLEEVDDVREMFVKNSSDLHPLLQRAFDLLELNYVRVLVRTAQRFHVRIEQLNDRIGRDSLTIRECGGWREEQDDEGKQYFVNDEGLVRLDAPSEWLNEEGERERRFEENRIAIGNTEEFVMSRVENLLYEINEEVGRCRELVREIDMEKEKKMDDLNEDMIDARGIVEGVVQCVSEKVLAFFNFETPLPITGFPSVGVTNAYSQRRLRVRPNFHLELEEFFDEEERS